MHREHPVWDDKAVERYEAWFRTRAGSFALRSELRLIDHMISSWPRRFNSLLEIGCGPGFFLDHFYKAGFETTGIDSSPAMIRAAGCRLDTKVDLHVGQGDHLPFRDKEFDYAALITVLEFADNPAPMLAEARRVARKGLLIAYLNKLSLYYLMHGLPLGRNSKGVLRSAHWFTPLGMRGLVNRTMAGFPVYHRSVLLGPVCSWRPRFPWKHLNQLIGLPMFGAFNTIRVDFKGETPLTPLYLESRAGVGG